MTEAELIAEASDYSDNEIQNRPAGYTFGLLARLAAALARHQWQPIETAPRDGTDFNVLWRAYYRPEGGLLLVDDPVGWIPALPTGDAP